MSKLPLLCVLLLFTIVSCRVTTEVKNECRSQFGLSLEESRLLKTSEELSQKKKCYIKCLFEHGGYLTRDGRILIDHLKGDKVGNEEKVYECLAQLPKINCEKVTQLVDCFSLK